MKVSSGGGKKERPATYWFTWHFWLRTQTSSWFSKTLPTWKRRFWCGTTVVITDEWPLVYWWGNHTAEHSHLRGYSTELSRHGGDDITQQFTPWQSAKLIIILQLTSEETGLFRATNHINPLCPWGHAGEDLFKKLKWWTWWAVSRHKCSGYRNAKRKQTWYVVSSAVCAKCVQTRRKWDLTCFLFCRFLDALWDHFHPVDAQQLRRESLMLPRDITSGRANAKRNVWFRKSGENGTSL